MGHIKHYLSGLLQTLILLGLAAILTACAGRPKQVEPTRPFTVTQVRVTTQSMSDFAFADRLQQRLDATAGRATSDIGLTSILRIVVLDRSTEAGTAGFLSASSRSATLDVVVVDAGTGQVLKSRMLNASAPARNGQSVDSVLVDRLVSEIRALLGLSGTAPYPVGGAKHDVAWPGFKSDTMDDGDFNDPVLISADPLLNGTVTPTSPIRDVKPETRPAIDLSRPLLSAEPQNAEPLAQDAVSPVKPVNMPKAFTLPATPPQISAEAAASSGDEPCIITLDNDCSDPDSQ